MEREIRYDAYLRKVMASGSGAESRRCWTCGTCDFDCPVNGFTNRLRPQKINRMATLGMLEELIDLPEIWYCLGCRRCSQHCPNTVKPSAVIEYIRREAVSRGRIPWSTVERYQDLFTRFQRVRFRTTAACLKEELPERAIGKWIHWLETPVSSVPLRIISATAFHPARPARVPMMDTGAKACYTCGECSSACPVSGHRNVFDPRMIVRYVQLGHSDELLSSPAIWLCVECGRCTEACPQKVDPRETIRQLREAALETGTTNRDFLFRLEKANKMIFPWFLSEIDLLFGFSSKQDAGQNDSICA